ncbi:amidohydrolase [Microbacterium sp. SORGH_AS_0888]|uniref:amidohydrolase n=1 Tax=Microbacterium sp. SORGH_AS_0888 TaxID=3041791 RepID=UPI002788C97C|nr:amidohydrolase family protein [Microbacterium sp. SORGH_AS_0888]MDQ1129299.1 putative amidohydrolase YtcJ [Microbacterium sp. SORGH_AS_0888]
MSGTAVYVAPVLTMDPERPRAEAFAVRDDRILAVGTRAEVTAAAGRGAAVTTLDGVVLPGLIDAHLHMQRGGLKAMSYTAADATVDEISVRMLETFHAEDWAGEEPPTLDERVASLRRFQVHLHSLGFTGAVDPATTPEEMRGYQEAARRGALTMRTLAMPYLEIGAAATPDVDAVIATLGGLGAATGLGDEMLRIGPIKVYVDGEATKGQALLEEPWDASGYRGAQRISDEDYARLVAWCAAHGWGVGTHAVGGAAIALVVREYAKAGAAAVRAGRFQIIHGYLEPSAEVIAQAARIGAIASLQPSIIWHNGAALREKLGGRAERSNPVRSWLDAGTTVAFGSDGPFFEFDPRRLIWQAVTRRVRGAEEPLSDAEAIEVAEGFAAYTTGAAYAAMAEDDRGMIRAGALADWALWAEDPLNAPIDELLGIPVLRTEVGGRTVYERTES